MQFKLLGVIAALLLANPVWAMGELFGVALGLKVENLQGWDCQLLFFNRH